MRLSVAGLAPRLHGYVQRNPNIPEAIAAFAIKLVGAGLSFGFSFLVARTLGATGNGNFALALTTALAASAVSLMGLDYVLLRTMAGDIKEGDLAGARGASRSALLATSIAAVAVGVVLALIGAPLLHAAMGKSLDQGLILLSAVAVLPLTLNRMAVMSLRGAGGVLAAQWLEGPQAMLVAAAVLLGLFLANYAIGPSEVVTLYFGTAALSALVAWLAYAWRARRWPAPTPTPAIPMLRQGGQISFIVLSRLILDWIVLLALGASYSTFEVGQFRTAWQVSALVMLLVSTFDTVAGPRIAAAFRIGDVADIRRIMRQSVATMSIISLPLFVISLGFPEWVLGLFGPDFVAGANALRILALGQMVNVLSGPLGVMLLMTGNERSSLIVSIISLALLAVCSVTLIPAFGLIGAALTTALTIACRTIISQVMVSRALEAIGTPR